MAGSLPLIRWLSRSGGIDLYIDLGAEKLLTAEKDGDAIAVEIKSFLGPSFISEFHTALGQFLNYRYALAQRKPAYELFLAVPVDVYQTFFTLTFTQGILTQYAIKILVYNPETEEVHQWIK
nr:element excision factor XisH family protein [Candidatus Chloroploca sp. Khr17]